MRKLIDFIANLSPFLAPIPTAYLIGYASWSVLQFPAPVAIFTALAIELLGISISDTSLMLYQYNRSKKKIEPEAPIRIAYGILSFYILIAVLLTVFLDSASLLARAIFPFLSLAGIVTLALRSDHARRLEANAEAKEQRKLERIEAREKRITRPASRNPAWVCGTCGASFAKQQSLAAHLRTHTRKEGAASKSNGNEKEHEYEKIGNS